ncbi:YciI family protein [Flavobacterium beibuense]|uniref:Transcription initiation protein n=1 Tax=Flavobacterium beibuense F44-8 TaxID=1406840 RepID=A0A0A2LKI4_9FLAO|nr:YciI family protein [Flavobacterium beibuense]KGO80757.1 transcription initiation protein [Flavobacterium beibuense F44-8]
MKEFALLFRHVEDFDTLPEDEKPAVEKKWQDWIGGIAAQGKLIGEAGVRLASGGKVLKPAGVVTDGPFVEIRECLGGLIVVKADTLEEAVTLAHGCPAMDRGGSVEVRPIFV